MKYNPCINAQVSATDEDLLTVSCCVFTSSRYRYRYQWERNQSLNVCVSQSSRSEWVPSRCLRFVASPTSPSQPSAQLLVNRSASFPPMRSHRSALFTHDPHSFTHESHCCSEAWCRFMNTPFSWIKAADICCDYICACIDQDRSDCKFVTCCCLTPI